MNKQRIGLLVSSLLIVLLAVSNVWFYMVQQNQIVALNDDKNSLQDQIRILNDTVNGLQNQVSQLQADKTDLQNQIDTLTHITDRLEPINFDPILTDASKWGSHIMERK